MKVLITGGAGFIGSHLADRLLARGDEVLVIDNFATARRDNLGEHERLTLVEGTIVDPELVQRTFAGFEPDVVAHAAASYKDPDDWSEDAATNATGTANVVKASKTAGVRRLVYFQTALCYGLHPLEQPITLDHPLRPGDSSYAISKTAGEHYVRAERPRLGLAPARERVRAAQRQRPSADLLPAPDRGQAVLRDGHAARLHLRAGPDRPRRRRRSTARARAAPTTPPRAPTTRSRSCSTRPSARSQLDPAPEVEVRDRNPDDAFTILLDPSRTSRGVRLDAEDAARGGRRGRDRVLPRPRDRQRRTPTSGSSRRSNRPSERARRDQRPRRRRRRVRRRATSSASCSPATRHACS